MPGSRDKDLVRRLFTEVFNDRNEAATRELIAADFRGHHPASPNVIHGPDGILEAMKPFWSAFSNLRYTIDILIAEGELVAAHWSATGTHDGLFMLRGSPFKPVAPTKRVVGTTGTDIFRIADGKIVEAWVVSDLLGVLVQLGAIPSGPVH
jgi:predicted SnoaL-like aldol condensation-catalyzing enzyme